jgi:hypothetical protein
MTLSRLRVRNNNIINLNIIVIVITNNEINNGRLKGFSKINADNIYTAIIHWTFPVVSRTNS